MNGRVIRCCCGRCAGGVTYLRFTDYIDAHQLAPTEYVLDSEVSLSVQRHPSNIYAADAEDEGA